MKTARKYWLVFATCALAALGGMGWITVQVVALERAEARARSGSEHMDRVRLALWRMDSWLNAQLAPEAARPYFDYLAFHGERRAWTRGLGAIQPGEVVTPSPLLTFRSELFPLHFQIDQAGALTSPQVPTGNERDLAEGSLGLTADFTARAGQLADLGRFVRAEYLGARLGRAATFPMNCIAPPTEAVVVPVEFDAQSRFRQSVAAKNSVEQQASWAVLGSVETSPGPLLPIWLDAAGATPAESRLVFARRVDVGGGALYQGFSADWGRLRAALLEQVGELFPDESVQLVRQDEPDDLHRAHLLATVPARLTAPEPAVPSLGVTPTRSVLITAWVALLLAVAAIGATLGSALSFGHKRARFASAVTHELRSPLTTFRMYSEMLAEGMVTEPERREEYVQTLYRESGRLARLVENVLAYARIEDGRQSLRTRRLTLAELMERIRPVLEQRAEDAEFALQITVAHPDAVVDVDPEAVEQVLFGLCDNACKYAGSGAAQRTVEVEARALSGMVEVAVRDHGPGIPAEHRRAVFRAFERGQRSTGESVIPGVGLGLALARGLARQLSGELVLDRTVTDGARFVLRLPSA